MSDLFGLLRQTIKLIPRGKVASYGQVATAAGFPGAARQVVWALHSSKGLPWHRVVGAGGRIMLRGDQQLEQRLRLENEGVKFRGPRIRMDDHEFQFPAQSKRSASPPTYRRKSQPARPPSARSGRGTANKTRNSSRRGSRT